MFRKNVRNPRPRRLSLLFVAFASFWSTALALDGPSHPVTIVLDAKKTAIRWTLVDVLHTVHGTFRLQQGTVCFDPATGAAEGLVVVDARSGESGNAARDSRMHKTFLESDRYPTITFVPNHVSGEFDLKQDHVVLVDGTFRLHGAEHSLQLRLRVHPVQSGLVAQTHFVVPYVQWGIKNPSTFVLRVNKTVDIDVESDAAVTP